MAKSTVPEKAVGAGLHDAQADLLHTISSFIDCVELAAQRLSALGRAQPSDQSFHAPDGRAPPPASAGSASRSADDETAMLWRALAAGFYDDASGALQLRAIGHGEVGALEAACMPSRSRSLNRAAYADLVTMLPNRFWLMNFMLSAVDEARAGGTALALLYVNLGNLKPIQYCFGDAESDQLLRTVAARLAAALRPRDQLARVGTNQFVIVLDPIGRMSDVARTALAMAGALREPVVLDRARSHALHASIGTSMFPRDAGHGEALLRCAELAMEAAQAAGTGQVRAYQPDLSKRLRDKLELEQALRTAIARDEFVLHFQPRVDSLSGEIRGLEALVRWRHPQRGLLAPLEFIPVAEATGLIVQLGDIVIRCACAQLAGWRDRGLVLVPVSINVSPRQLIDSDLHARILLHCATYQIAPSLLEIEITESSMIEDAEHVRLQLAALAALGVRLLVDDFGTGYSSLSQLQQFDMDVLKVDKSFTAQVCAGPKGKALVVAIISLARVFDMNVVAEGVETLDQLHALQALGCNEIQGYLVSKPVPAEDVPALLTARFLVFPAAGCVPHA